MLPGEARSKGFADHADSCHVFTPMNEEIKARKEEIRARFRAGLKSWKILVLPAALGALYAITFALFYFVGVWVNVVIPVKGFEFPSCKAGFLMANLAVGIEMAVFVILYVLCPVTGRFAMKLRAPKNGRSSSLVEAPASMRLALRDGSFGATARCIREPGRSQVKPGNEEEGALALN